MNKKNTLREYNRRIPLSDFITLYPKLFTICEISDSVVVFKISETNKVFIGNIVNGNLLLPDILTADVLNVLEQHSLHRLISTVEIVNKEIKKIMN